jgi:V8-like Glu-specific endopeptidase
MLVSLVPAVANARRTLPAPVSPTSFNLPELILSDKAQLHEIADFLAASRNAVSEIPFGSTSSKKVAPVDGAKAARNRLAASARRRFRFTEMVGGERLDDAPAVGVIRFDGRLHCTATVIRPKVVLTAAHCLAKETAAQIRDAAKMDFLVGTNAEAPSRIYKITRVIPHDDYVMQVAPLALTNDVGIALLEEKFSGTPYSLPKTSLGESLCDATLKMVGYGYTAVSPEEGPSGAGTRMAVDIPVRCEAGTLRFGSASQGICPGDSGGPALLSRDASNPPVVVGVHSWVSSILCNGEGADERTDTHLEWFKAALQR